MAKNYRRKIVLEFDYAEVKNGVTKVSSQMSLLNREYQAAKAEADVYGDATDKLAVRQQYLQERIKILNHELSEHRKRLEEAKTTGNEKATENYGKKVKYAESQLKELDAQLVGVSANLEKSKVATEGAAEKMSKFGEKTTSIGKKMSLGLTAPIVAAGVKAFKMASDFEQATGKLEVVFQNSSDGMKKWAEDALSTMNLSKATAIQTAADYGALFQGVGISIEKSAEWSKSLTERVADLSNFYDTTTEETISALNSIVTGTVQPMRRFGITMTEANLQQWAFAHGIRKTVREMSESEKVQLRYQFVMDKTKMAVGTTAREADSAGAQMKKFKETVSELALKFGEVLLPVIVPIIETINKILTAISHLDDSTKKFIVTFLGILAVVGPVLIIIGKLATAISSITSLKATFAAKSVKEGANVSKAMMGMGNSFSFTFLKIMGVIVVLSIFIALLAVLFGKSKEIQDTMAGIGNAAGNITGSIQQANSNIKRTQIKAFAVGTNYVDSDQLAYVHEGEAIIPKHKNPFAKGDGFNGNLGGGDTIILNVNMDEISDVQKLVDVVKKAKQRKRAGGELEYAL